MIDSEAYYRKVIAAGYEAVPNPVRLHILLAEAKALDMQEGINSFAHTVADMVIFPEITTTDDLVSLGTINGKVLEFPVSKVIDLIETHLHNPKLFNPLDTRWLLEKGVNRYGETIEDFGLSNDELLAIHIISLRMQWLAMCTFNPDLVWVLQAEDVMSYDEVISLLAILPEQVYPQLRNT